jgi:hypothetical protein
MDGEGRKSRKTIGHSWFLFWPGWDRWLSC